MKNRSKNKLYKKVIFCTSLTFLASSSVILIANKEQGIDLVVKEINNIKSKTLQSNIYNTAKVDPLYEVKTLRKVTSDKNAINVLFLGDNYAKNSGANEFSDFCYTNVVVPWLSTQYPRSYEDFVKQDDLTRGTRNAFQTFLNDKINVYSIQPNFKYNTDITNSKDTFFSVFTNVIQGNYYNLKIAKSGPIKINVLTQDLSSNFLEDGGIATPATVGMIRYGGTGRANTTQFYLTTTANTATTHIHEMGHSIWGLADEYGDKKTLGVNRAYITDTSNVNNIPWKEFLNFRGVGVVRAGSSTTQYIPAHGCVMNVTRIDSEFCEVCLHQIAKKAAQITQQPYLYIADPQLIPTKNNIDYTNSLYSREYMQQQELYKFKVDKGSNSTMDFRTVVDNLTPVPRKLKLRVYISGTGGIDETSEVFTINPGELKQLVFVTKNQTGTLNKSQNTTVIGEVIDADTNEVLATSLDRLNYSYLSSESFSNNVNYGKRTYKVNIKFVNNKTNTQLPNIKPISMIKRDGAKYKLEKILFNGYRLDETKSKIDNKELTINGKSMDYTYYYDPLPYKTLKLKLLNQNNQQVQTKNVKVYEGQTFIPKSTDFFLYNLEAFIGDSVENENWVNSVYCPTETYTYNNIQDNITELVYKISNEKPTYLSVKDIKMFQGDNLFNILNSNYSRSFNYSVFNNDYKVNDYTPPIIYNTVDTSTPGEYYVVFYFKNNFNIVDSKQSLFKVKVTVEKNSNPSYKPNQLESEKQRLENYTILWLDKLEEYKGSKEDFESITQANLLSNISNLNLNENKYTYEVVDFLKFYPGIDNKTLLGYNFKIKITDKATQNLVITNAFDKYIWLKDDAPITPPDTAIEVNNEINRINGLSLSLKNPVLTQAEVNNINQKNILENVNGWVQTTGFAYEVVDFNNINNQFKFKIRASKNSISIASKEFILSYQIKNDQTEEGLIEQEINRINGLNLSLTKNSFSQNEIDQITSTNFSSYISNWNLVTSNSNKYKYEIINFNKNANKFNFNIKVTLISNASLSRTSNTFNLSYSVSPDQPTIEEQLNNQKQRIDNLTLTLTQDVFDQSTLDSIVESNFSKWIQNWNSDVISSYSDFNFTIVKFAKSTNSFTFNIQITKENKSVESKQFQLAFTIKAIDQQVLNEKTRIESLDIKWNDAKTISSNDLFRWMNTPPTLEELSLYILNLDSLDQTKFNYKFTWLPYSAYTNDLTQGILRISVSLKNSSQSSAPAIIDKPITNILIQDNNGNKKNIMPILLGTLIPGGIIVVAVILVLTLIKKRRKY